MPNTATRRRVPMWMSRWGLRAWSLLGAAGLLLLAAFVLLMLVMRSLLAAIAQHDELEAGI